eukprot:CAMPEP_0183714232 /NCGR_PEP_ID=MMETSP0737-20130205/8832_1 /TAXON_ID=385413 /ORGANISM="Thalassiosira miniscula, Strain CCMP1093" /LENGTH=363 /DNA_ID=CAMNT_0025943139 /DNA_START=26 /DNA_END=1117 /DNA_ORIENTATION=-
MTQNIIVFVILGTTLAILLSSTARIGFAIFSENNGSIGFDVRLDNSEDYVDEDAQHDSDHVPILPINRRKLAVSRGEPGPGGVSDPLSNLLELSSQTRKLDEGKLPYKCGVILYDNHVPGEDGEMLNKWIKAQVHSNDGATFISSEERESKESFVSKVEEQIDTLGPKEWKMVYSHENGLGFDADEYVLRSWRDIVERQGCGFVAAAIFSDPLDHSMKHTKKLFSECLCTMMEFKERIKRIMAENPWMGQLDHFLYNSGEKPPGIPNNDKVKRGMQLLKDHFEVVMVDDDGRADNFAEEILRITGWISGGGVEKATVSDVGGIVYSKDLISKYGKMSTANGDADFMDAVNHVYHNSLGYLMLQ